MVTHLPAARIGRQKATSLSIFDYLHRCQLSAIQTDEIREHRDGDRMLAELSACRPLGALYARTEVPGYRPHDFTCRRSRQCPWCHARKVLDLYERLMAGPCSREKLAGMYLVRLQVRVSSNRLAYMSKFVRFCAERGYIKAPELLTQIQPVYPHFESRLVREFFANWLFDGRRGPDGWRLQGGLVSFAVDTAIDPCVVATGEECLRYDLNLIGVADRRAAEAIFAMNGGEESAFLLRFDLGYEYGVHAVPCHASVFRGDYKHALRHLLFGPSLTYRPPQLSYEDCATRADEEAVARWAEAGYGCDPLGGDVWTNGIHDGRHHEHGNRVDGVFRWPALGIAKPRGWWDCGDATDGVPLYEAFGDWTGRTRPADDAAAERKLDALRRGRQARATRISDSAPAIEAAAREILAANPKLGSRQLVKVLAARELRLAERPARDLLKRLKAGE